MNRSPAFYIWWKEFRAVLPIWATAIIALLIPTITAWDVIRWNSEIWHMFVYPIGIVAVAAAMFTREFQDRTLTTQFLLPQHRLTPLVRKFGVVFMLQVLMLAVFLWVLSPHELREPTVVWIYCVGANVVALAGGCFWGMVMKHGAGTVAASTAFPWVPGIIGIGAMHTTGLDLDISGEVIVGGGLVLYSIACFVGALVYWRRLQLAGDAVATSRLDIAVLGRLTGCGNFVRRTAWITLMRKELGIVRFCFWVAAIMIVGAVLFSGTDYLLSETLETYGSSSRGEKWWDLQETLRALCGALFMIFLGLIPTLAGSLAFAEETHLGNRTWQLTQPISSKHQWAIKFGVSGFTSFVLGIVLPGLVAWGYASLRVGNPLFAGFESDVVPTLLLVHVLVFCTAAWCATWSPTTLSAIMKAILVLSAFQLLQGWLGSVFASQTGGIFLGELADWRWAALGIVGVAVLLSVRNHNQVQIGRRQVFAQVMMLVILVVGVLFVDSRF